MGKRRLKVDFTDFWPGFVREENLMLDCLRSEFDVSVGDDPDLLFFSDYGNQYRSFSGPRIFWTVENTRPDFTSADFAITFDYRDDPRHFRYPLYAGYAEGFSWWDDLTQVRSDEEILQDWRSRGKFCCMVVSNGRSKRRIDFFHKLNRHRQVDSGGRYLNNVGGPVPDKLQFIRDYRFVISFENSCYPGYTTEKLVEPMVTGCIPIYWGNRLVDRELNAARFLHCGDPADDESMIERILEIDASEDEALRILREPVFHDNRIPDSVTAEHLRQFLCEVAHSLPQIRPVAASPLKRIAHLGRRVQKQIAVRTTKILGRQHR